MSLILYHDEEQKRAAELSKKREAQERKEVLITEIAKAGPFYAAEEYVLSTMQNNNNLL